MPSEMEKNTAAEEKYGERVGRDAQTNNRCIIIYTNNESEILLSCLRMFPTSDEH